MKKAILVSLLAIVGGGAVVGTIHYMKSSGMTADKTTKVKKVSNDAFVSLSDSVVTLYDAESEEHYILVELAMEVDNDSGAKKVRLDEPLYQSIIVATLADMKYDSARTMKISELRSLLTHALNSELKRRGSTIPYNDILIKKVIFQ